MNRVIIPHHITVICPVPQNTGRHWALLAGFSLYLVLRRLSSAPVLSALAASLLVVCSNHLVWYKAVPAVMLVAVGWLVAVVHVEEVSDREADGPKGETGGQKSERASHSQQGKSEPGGGKANSEKPKAGNGGSAGAGNTKSGKSGGGSSSQRSYTPPPSQNRPGVLLKSEAPHGAKGEVARVLRCTTWYDVLNVARFTQGACWTDGPKLFVY